MRPVSSARRPRALTGLLLASLVVAGCGSTAPSATAPSGSAASEPATPMDDAGMAQTDMSEMAPSGGHADMDHDGHTMEDVGAWYGQPADADEATRTIEVTVDDELTFDPDEFEVAQGEVVRFVVTNVGTVEHEFVLGDAAAQQQMAEEMASGDDHAHHGSANAVTIHGGETAELTWRFGTEPGTLLVGCHLPGHYEAGMKATVTVA